MEIKIKELMLVNLTSRKSEKSSKVYYNAVCLNNGFPVRLSCSEAFYNAFSKKLADEKILTLHNVDAFVSFYKDVVRINLI